MDINGIFNTFINKPKVEKPTNNNPNQQNLTGFAATMSNFKYLENKIIQTSIAVMNGTMPINQFKSQDVEENTKYPSDIIYNIAWNYILKLDINNSQTKLDILLFNAKNPDVLSYNLNKLLEYFIKKEEYHNCAHIRDILNILK